MTPAPPVAFERPRDGLEAPLAPLLLQPAVSSLDFVRDVGARNCHDFSREGDQSAFTGVPQDPPIGERLSSSWMVSPAKGWPQKEQFFTLQAARHPSTADGWRWFATPSPRWRAPTVTGMDMRLLRPAAYVAAIVKQTPVDRTRVDHRQPPGLAVVRLLVLAPALGTPPPAGGEQAAFAEPEHPGDPKTRQPLGLGSARQQPYRRCSTLRSVPGSIRGPRIRPGAAAERGSRRVVRERRLQRMGEQHLGRDGKRVPDPYDIACQALDRSGLKAERPYAWEFRRSRRPGFRNVSHSLGS